MTRNIDGGGRCYYATNDLTLMRMTLRLVPLLFSACATGAAEGQATDGKVPAAVLEGFAAQYPNEKSPRWERDRNGSYEAKFRLLGEKVRADFTPAGVWIETERSIKWKDLPDAVQEAIEEEYDRDDIEELEYTVSAEKGRFYDVEIDPKGEKKFDVEYREDGEKI